MTKARDLANAADVLDDVSATELSYVNGVTSAIQTQLDAKVAKSLVDAKGDLLVGSANDTVSRLAVASTAGWLLSVDSAETTGLKWAAPAAGGKIGQVVFASTTAGADIGTTTFADTNLSASITPSATSSKVLIMMGASWYVEVGANQVKTYAQILRGSTSILDFNVVAGFNMPNTSGTRELFGVRPFFYLDSPNTTSSTTYKLQGRVNSASSGATIRAQGEGSPSTIILMEVLA
jgi:hypothetical protein